MHTRVIRQQKRSMTTEDFTWDEQHDDEGDLGPDYGVEILAVEIREGDGGGGDQGVREA
jgi:hypothetical protein